MGLRSLSPTAVGPLILAVIVGFSTQALTLGFDDPATWIPDLITGWALVASGIAGRHARPDSHIGSLLLLSGFAWFIPNLTLAGVPWLAEIGRYGWFLHRGFLAHALVTFSYGKATTRTEQLIVGSFYVFAFANGIWRSALLTLIGAIALVLITAHRYTTSVGSERRRRKTALRLAVILGFTVSLAAVTNLVARGITTAYIGSLLYSVAVVTTGVGLAVELGTKRDDRGDVTDLVVELGGEQSPSIRDSLAQALGDPNLQIGYWSPRAGAFIDASGREVAPGETRNEEATTAITDGLGNPVAMVVHHPSLLEDPALVEAVEAATRLSSTNAGLATDLRGRVLELEASRRRLVMAGDDEQRRLESRLRAGPETRLVGLVREFEAFRQATPPGPAGTLFRDIEDHLNQSLDELRHLAVGLHPRLLTDVGLRGAVEGLAARSTTPVDLDISADHMPAQVEAAVYFVCSEALANVSKHATADLVSVRVVTHGESVSVAVVDDGVGGANPSLGTGLLHLRDRVETLGGTFSVRDATPRGTRLIAELPLGDGR
jgi:signal transduction histidine kinase